MAFSKWTGDKQNPHRGDGMLVDVLLFGAHPDDVEWGAGGTVLTLKARALHSALWISPEVKWDLEARARSATKRRRTLHPGWVPGFVKTSGCLIAESLIR